VDVDVDGGRGVGVDVEGVLVERAVEDADLPLGVLDGGGIEVDVQAEVDAPLDLPREDGVGGAGRQADAGVDVQVRVRRDVEAVGQLREVDVLHLDAGDEIVHDLAQAARV